MMLQLYLDEQSTRISRVQNPSQLILLKQSHLQQWRLRFHPLSLALRKLSQRHYGHAQPTIEQVGTRLICCFVLSLSIA